MSSRTVDLSVVPPSTVVYGFSFASSHKSSIKEFHQFATLTVTTPLEMAVLV